MCSIVGWHGDHAPLVAAEYLAFARSLPSSEIYGIIGNAEPLTDIVIHKFPSSLRRHYEKLARFPLGYLVVGDAIGSINPTYAQGMTIAALQVTELDAVLSARQAIDGIAPAFFKRAAKVVDVPW